MYIDAYEKRKEVIELNCDLIRKTNEHFLCKKVPSESHSQSHHIKIESIDFGVKDCGVEHFKTFRRAISL